jgi:glutathionyl-hydroquinone reductase
VEEILSKSKYLVGDEFTEADIRLFTTIVRFDVVYYVHFKTNKKHIYEYQNLWSYCREILNMKGIAETTRFDQIKSHYFGSHLQVNPHGIVPKGPFIDFTYNGERDDHKNKNS